MHIGCFLFSTLCTSIAGVLQGTWKRSHSQGPGHRQGEVLQQNSGEEDKGSGRGMCAGGVNGAEHVAMGPCVSSGVLNNKYMTSLTNVCVHIRILILYMYKVLDLVIRAMCVTSSIVLSIS